MVSGKVTLNGQAVAGEVIFVGADGKETIPILLSLNGEYSVSEPPSGTVKVVVRSMGGIVAPPPGGASSLAGGPSGQGVAPPGKFGTAKTTPVTFSVAGGKQTFNIELEKF
jgi:hypothetical protein